MARILLQDNGKIAVWGNFLDSEAQPVNWTLIAAYDESAHQDLHNQLGAGSTAIVWNDATQELSLNDVVVIDDTWITSRASEQLQATQLKEATAIAVAQGKAFLRRQLLSESPSALTIFDTLQTQVQSNPHLTRMVDNMTTLVSGANGWGALDTGTVQGRLRYIMIVQQVIAVLT